MSPAGWWHPRAEVGAGSAAAAAADGEPTLGAAAAASDLHAGVMRDLGAAEGEELTKMHIPAAAQLSPPPLQPSSSRPELPAPSQELPQPVAACAAPASSQTTLWLFRRGQGTVSSSSSSSSPKGARRSLICHRASLQKRMWAVALVLGDTHLPCSRIPKVSGKQSRSGAGAPPRLCFSRNHCTRPRDCQGRSLPAEALKAFTACPHTPLQPSGAEVRL